MLACNVLITEQTSAKLADLRPDSPASTAADPREVLRWHAAWALGLFVAGLALAIGARQNLWTFGPALGLGMAPLIGAWLLEERDSPRGRDMLVVFWAIVTAAACGVSGGVSGPLAVWCAAPMAAAVMLGGSRRLALGAAASLLAVAVAALAQIDRLNGVAPSGAAGIGLGFIGAASTAIGLAAALLSAQRRAARTRETQARGQVETVEALRQALNEHRAREIALEKALAEAEALNLGKSRFLANMSHELRTPLNAIMGFSDVMRQRIFGELPGRYAEYADLIHDAGAHLLDLINDVLDMSKIEAARYELSIERLDAREPVQAALRLMRLQADDAGIQLRGGLPATPLLIQADRRALKQITLNLVSNALKFTPKGGLVTVDLQSLARALELTVTDTGLGIAAEDLQRLGRPFEQAGDATQQAQGTGLGLSLVRAFAELHGGEMLIESRLGEGTAVTVLLPMAAAAAASSPDRDAGERVEAEALSADA
jgi:signal transduction histidine kinase